MRIFENIILDTPYLFLKKIPYAWFAAVVFLSSLPAVSVAFILITLLGLLAMWYQEMAWQKSVLRDFHDSTQPYIIDRPKTSPGYWLRNLVILLACSLLISWFVRDIFELSFTQWFLLIAGVMLLYKDTLIFGAYTTFILTSRGLAIRYIPGHVDYRILLKYSEIKDARLIDKPDQEPLDWTIVSPIHSVKRGILLFPANSLSFTKTIEKLFIFPTQPEVFLRKLA
jgi:hypothetical protein